MRRAAAPTPVGRVDTAPASACRVERCRIPRRTGWTSEPVCSSEVPVLRDSLALVEPAASARPVYLVPVADLRYGSVVTRICGDAGSAIGIGGVWGRDARHHYSK